MFDDYRILDPLVQAGKAPAVAYLDWWPTDEVERRLDYTQYHLIDPWEQARYPGALRNGLLNDGQRCTLRALDALSGAPEKQLDLLRAGVLFYWTKACRGGRTLACGALWPRMPELKRMQEELLARTGLDSPWRYTHTEVVPATYHQARDGQRLEPWDGKDLRDINDFTAVLDSEVQLLLKHWKLVVIWRGAEGDSERVMKAERTMAESRAREAARTSAFALEQAARKEAVERLRAVHVRYGEWGTLAAAELATLVWAKPLRDVAHDFGVSDVAVKKRCKQLKLETPPQGYWLRKKGDTGVSPGLPD